MKLAREVSIGSPTLEASFPYLFSRSQPVIDKNSPLVYAASLLRFHSAEAAMMLAEDARPMRIGLKVAFVGGYSILATLVRVSPEKSYSALFEPSGNSAVGVPPLKSVRDLGELLRSFEAARFGFAAVTRGDMFAMVGLSDVIGLYQAGTLGSDLTVREVASPAVRVGRQTSVREALRIMFDRRIRRLFLGRAHAFVSDREVVSSIFSPRRLTDIKRSPGTLLEGTLLDVGPVEAPEVEGDMPLKEAATHLVRSQGRALVCDAGVISPWDLVMKPFLAGHLNVK